MYISWITPEALEVIGTVAVLIGFAVTLIVPAVYAISTAIEDRKDAREHLARHTTPTTDQERRP